MWLVLLLAGCHVPATFRCETSDQCSGAGTCEPNGFCSFADSGCTSGRSYDPSAGDLGGTCVDGPDAGVIVDAPPPVVCLTSPTYATVGTQVHRYRLTGALDYDAATAACAADRAYLATIDNDTEQSAVHTFATNTMWIGYDDLTTEGTFAWEHAATSTFTHWAANEPNNYMGHEDCAFFLADGTWNDTPCGETRPALCECEAGYTPPAIPACMTMPGATIVEGRRYFVHTSPHVSWAAAKADCEATGAYLMVLGDLAENYYINDVSGLPTLDLWLGLSRPAGTNNWGWVDGAPFYFTNWSANYPVSDAQSNCVVTASATERWENARCTDSHAYICECDPLPP